ncbi:L-threonine aldolase [Catalinimonas alkaloidigena]|uniref:L-threonine aldolase n=1 Tax=Catalinimonas alkaloidigena TaxID=1075417 RepID=A0A1G9DEM9_9BACT|nr:GntG family PLP-dependent aldolase [Catalinimonas alkaloidigena]SDK62307.1 L-threonine aldolase [Catalinimonas alkaloidigena]
MSTARENKLLDYRSDTVTRPTAGMLDAMMRADVGDDVYGEDPTVRQLEEATAAWFGMEAGLYCPSGTMTNQIAIKLHTQPGDEVVCDRLAHIYNYEGGGIAFNAGASVRLIDGDRGRMTAAQVAANLNPDDLHFPPSTLVALENTVNKGGGCCYPLAQMQEVAALCRQRGIACHLDGARVFNALVATGDDPKAYGQCFDTISVCFSKGLGAPVGSVLIGSAQALHKARRYRKVFGGGMRQAGYIAAGALYALHHQVDRLADDHRRAAQLAKALTGLEYVGEVYPAETNIVIFSLREGLAPADLLAYLRARGILASGFGPKHIRMVTHLDIDDVMLTQTLEALQAYAPQGVTL